MLNATCPACKQKAIRFLLRTDEEELSIESRECGKCGRRLTDEEAKQKIRILVDAIIKKTGVDKTRALIKALTMMLPAKGEKTSERR